LEYGVISSRPLRLILAASLLVSVGLKVAAKPISPRSDRFTTEALPAFLILNGYTVEIKDTPGGKVIQAALNDCRLRIVEARPTGGSGEALRVRGSWDPLATEQDSITFVLDGQVYASQPLARTILQDLKFRFEERFGVEGEWIPAFAVRATPACARHELPWTWLSDPSRT
jgi:hypothetical protein